MTENRLICVGIKRAGESRFKIKTGINHGNIYRGRGGFYSGSCDRIGSYAVENKNRPLTKTERKAAVDQYKKILKEILKKSKLPKG